MSALTEVFVENSLVKVFGLLRLSELEPEVVVKYSKRKRRPPLPWTALVFFLLLMYFYAIRSERQLEKWLSKRAWLLKFFKFERAPDHSSFSRFRGRLGGRLFKRVFTHLVKVCQSLGLLAKRIVGQDSKFFKARANKRKQLDKDAAWGHVKKDEPLGYGYKVHLATDVNSELPVSLEVLPANEHDTVGFLPVMQPLLQEALMLLEKFIADSAYDDTDIRQELVDHNVQPCIAVNGRGYYASTPPKDPDYAKRSGCERVNSRAQEYYRLDDLKLFGLSNALTHAALSLSAILLNAITAFTLRIPTAVISPLAVRNALE